MAGEQNKSGWTLAIIGEDELFAESISDEVPSFVDHIATPGRVSARPVRFDTMRPMSISRQLESTAQLMLTSQPAPIVQPGERPRVLVVESERRGGTLSISFSARAMSADELAHINVTLDAGDVQPPSLQELSIQIEGRTEKDKRNQLRDEKLRRLAQRAERRARNKR